MYGLGTIVNVAAIIIGGLIGLIGGKFLTRRFQDMITMTCGTATLFLGAGGALSKMIVISDGALTTQGSLMMIVSLIAGALIGEALRIEDHLDRFGSWLKEKSGNGSDNTFVSAFVTASLTVCIGAMAIVGSIEDGIYANHSILFTKAILDFIIILIMTSSLGKGCIFSAVSVGLFQGLVTVLSRLIQPFMTEPALNNLSFVGNIMIFCVGLNLMLSIWHPDPAEGRRIKVGNMLPGLVIAVLWALF